jgi:NADPH:quinone reductase-like Zn-dependent oxidoreductase
MLAVYCESQSKTDPLAGLVVGERPEPQERPGWTVVDLKAATLNHHDLWSLQGVGLPADRLPMTLGCDGSGVTPDGREVIMHAVIASEGWSGDETLDPKRSLFSEVHQGTFSEKVLVPNANLIDKPAGMSWEVAAALPTAWLTAYRMLFSNADVTPGSLVLVQGAGGGHRHGHDPARRRGGPAGLGDDAVGGEAGRGAGAGRRGGLRVRRAAAREGRRGD